MSNALHTGAAAFSDLMARIGDLSDATCLDMHDHGEDGDSRDYVSMAEMIAQSLQVNLNHAEHAHRQGYLRALTSLLCIVADGCGPGDDWNPLAETENAFSAPRVAEALIGRMGQ